jgi:hypothetical protein
MLRGVTRRLLSLAFGLVVACGGAPPPAAEEPVAMPRAEDVERADTPPSLEPYAGHYALAGEAVQDGCGGEIVLVARELEVDARRRAVRVEVVDRDYEAHVEDDHLVATGRFDVRDGCPESTVYERFDLRHAAGGGLEGELLSTWLMWPSCMAVCTVRFTVRATPEAPAGPGP